MQWKSCVVKRFFILCEKWFHEIFCTSHILQIFRVLPTVSHTVGAHSTAAVLLYKYKRQPHSAAWHTFSKHISLLFFCRSTLRLESLEDAVVLESEDDLLSDKHGCPAYVSPEILRTNSQYSGRAADMWGLGVMLYTMLVGR